MSTNILRIGTPNALGDVEPPTHDSLKQRNANHHYNKGQSPHADSSPKVKLSHSQYTVGWVCALHIEMAAAIAMLDNVHASLPQDPNDGNTYTLGSIGSHNIAISSLPTAGYGTNNAATVASNMSRSFPQLRVRLLVGIGGGIPGEGNASVRLGDVVVSTSVVQYDLGKVLPDGRFKRTGVPKNPPFALMTAVAKMRADHETRPSKMSVFLSEMLERNPRMVQYVHPGKDLDWLFESSYDHVEGMSNCKCCDKARLVKDRPVRESCDPVVHYGKIASGNQVMKSADERDRLSLSLGIVCFEMEAAGLMDNFPCLVIRGICDYSDSHKQKDWQQYAAASAAAYAKELLHVLPAADTTETLTELERAAYLKRRTRLFDLLHFPQLRHRHDNIKVPYARTCEWLLQHPDYEEWLDPKNMIHHRGFLWINGKPGAGKSTLMKFLYTKEVNSHTPDSSTIAFFFNSRGSDLEKTSIGMYRSLLFQLLNSLEDLKEVFDQLRTSLDSQDEWHIEILQGLFMEAVMRLGSRRLTCFIDALDECTEEEVQDMIYYFEHLGQSATEKGLRLLLCLSTRHYPCISFLYGKKLVLEDQSGHEQDLRHYVQQAFQSFGKGKLMEEVQGTILSKAAGVFMWVVLVVDILKREIQRGRWFAVKSRLQDIPSKLSDLFKDILTRDNYNMDDLLLSIQWILFSKKPLGCDEYYFALASGLSSNADEFGEWNEDYTPLDAMQRYVSSSSKGLAEVTESGLGTIQFIHESVPDFLIKDDGLHQLWPEAGDNFEALSHERLKHCCFSYMKGYISGETEIRASDKKKQSRGKGSLRFSFLQYTVNNVLCHADLAATSIPQDEFLEKFPLTDWIQLHGLLWPHEEYTRSASLIYILAEKGLPRLIRTIREKSPRVEVLGERYMYPLFAALANGNQGALEALVEQTSSDSVVSSICARLSYGNHGGETAFCWNLTEGPGPYVLLFIKSSGIHLALKKGSQVEFAFLLRFSDQIDLIGIFLGWLLESTPKTRGSGELIIWASAMGSEYIVRRLLEKGANTETINRLGQTPLMIAAARAHTSVIKLLLERNTNIEARDNTGRTSLILATMSGSFDTVKLLLEHGCDINNKDNSDRSALDWAESKGNTIISKYLLDKSAERVSKVWHSSTTGSFRAGES